MIALLKVDRGHAKQIGAGGHGSLFNLMRGISTLYVGQARTSALASAHAAKGLADPERSMLTLSHQHHRLSNKPGTQPAMKATILKDFSTMSVLPAIFCIAINAVVPALAIPLPSPLNKENVNSFHWSLSAFETFNGLSDKARKDDHYRKLPDSKEDHYHTLPYSKPPSSFHKLVHM
jgi:hypothetical protein